MIAEFEGRGVPPVPGDDLVKAVRDEAFRPSIVCQGCHLSDCINCIVRRQSVLDDFYHRCRELDSYKQQDSTPSTAGDGFIDIPEGISAVLPFN